MRLLDEDKRCRRLELTADDLAALQRGMSIGDGRNIIVSVVPKSKERVWTLRTEHCGDCDRPEICALIQGATAPCHRNRFVSLREVGELDV